MSYKDFFCKTIKFTISEITLKILGTGDLRIFNYAENNIPDRCPNYIYLNHDRENNILNSNDCNLIDINLLFSEISTIKLVWKSRLSNVISL